MTLCFFTMGSYLFFVLLFALIFIYTLYSDTMLALGVCLLLQSLFTVQTFAAPLFIRSFIDFVRRADTCNGNAALCDRKYSDVTFIGTHDSAFVGILPTQNQIKSITDQLNGGVRFLQSQTHNFENTLKMCHTSCDLEDAGTVEDYLQEVKAWMDLNPRDMVTLLLTNPDNVPMSTFDGIFKTVGLDQFAFKPASSPNPLGMQDWPTLGDMLNSGQRLVAFIGMYFLDFSGCLTLTIHRLRRRREVSPLPPR
jgi:hypothetical protein